MSGDNTDTVDEHVDSLLPDLEIGTPEERGEVSERTSNTPDEVEPDTDPPEGALTPSADASDDGGLPPASPASEEADTPEPDDDGVQAPESDDGVSVEAPETEPDADYSAAPAEDETLESVQKQRDGLLRQVKKQREKAKETLLAPVVPIAPVPQLAPVAQIQPTPPATPQPLPTDSRVGIVLDPNGTDVYVDQAAQDARTIELIRQANTPTPQQMEIQVLGRAIEEFRAADPKVNGAIVDAMKVADDYVTQHMEASGRLFVSPAEVTQFLIEGGQAQTVIDGTPGLTTENFPEYMSSMASRDPAIRTGMLRRMLPTAGAAVNPIVDPSKPVSVAGAPTALADKGGTRSVSSEGDEAEFTALNSKYENDPVLGVTDAQYERIKELGQKLGKEGYA
jgi:hypothetical protein